MPPTSTDWLSLVKAFEAEIVELVIRNGAVPELGEVASYMSIRKEVLRTGEAPRHTWTVNRFLGPYHSGRVKDSSRHQRRPCQLPHHPPSEGYLSWPGLLGPLDLLNTQQYIRF